MRASWVLGLRHLHRNSRWRHRVSLAFPVLARGGGRWGRARSAGHQASRASPAPRAALVSARRALERARASRPRRGDLLPIRLDPMPAVRGYAALFAPRGFHCRCAGPCCGCAMVVVLRRSRLPRMERRVVTASVPSSGGVVFLVGFLLLAAPVLFVAFLALAVDVTAAKSRER